MQDQVLLVEFLRSTAPVLTKKASRLAVHVRSLKNLEKEVGETALALCTAVRSFAVTAKTETEASYLDDLNTCIRMLNGPALTEEETMGLHGLTIEAADEV